MSTEKITLAWVTKRPARFESQRFEPVCHLLHQHHYEVIWVEAPSALDPAKLQTWLVEKLPAHASAVFFGDKEIEWFKTILSGIRGLTGSHLSHVPFFWVYEDADHHLLDKMGEVGFNDFCHMSIKPHELLFRLRLRWKERQDRIGLEQLLKEQAIKNARNETILKQREEFLAVCAHDLRSPLGLIQSGAAMILNATGGRSQLAPTHHELLTRIKRQATQAITLVGDLLDVTSLEQGLQPRYELLNLHALLNEFYNDYRAQAEAKQITFHYENDIQDWRILGDSDRIRQLLQNLFSNALKFTDNGKNIFLSVAPFQGRRKADPLYPMIVISLKDEGRGIPSKEMQKIFDRFSQMKDQSRADGRGLGLTVAKQISNLHEGNIWVESAEGQGSTFFVIFPHVISRTPAAAKPEKSPGVVRCLIAEPSPDRRDAYFHELENWGMSLTYAKDGVEALALLFHLLPDVFILRASLPKMEVSEILAVLKSDRLTAQIPVLLVGEEGESIENNIETHLFDRVLKLPLVREEFELTLKAVGKLLTPPAPLKKAA